MKEKIYKQGATTVWTDGEKLIISNPNGKKHIPENVDRIFGVGEFDKIYENKYSETEEVGKINTLSRKIEIISGYIPKRAEKDIMEQSMPGTKKEDYSDFFERKD